MDTPIESACWRALACSEAPASLCVSAACYRFAENIGIVPMVVAELKFREVERKIFLADVMISANDSALQQSPKGIKIGSVNLATYILAFVVIDSLMPEAFAAKAAIARVLIGSYKLNPVANGFADESFQCFRIGIFNNLADDVALAADRSDDASLAGADAAGDMRPLLPMAIFVFAANEGLIYFDNAHKLTELGILHGSAEPMTHIPSCRIGRADLPLYLLGANAFLGIEYLPEHFKPNLKWILRILEDRPDVERKTVGIAASAFGIRALPLPRQSNVVNCLRFPASRAAYYAIRPAPKEQIFTAGFIVRKGRHQLPERHHVSEHRAPESVRQVLYNSPDQSGHRRILPGKNGSERNREIREYAR
jgi:hypothetical protein